jgi:hypothetical protein
MNPGQRWRDALRFEPSLHGADFMANAFDRVGEPLNLLPAAQAWFAGQVHRHLAPAPRQALVLGVTPWLGRLAAERHERVWMADQSRAMVDWARGKLEPPPPACTLLQSDWLTLELPPLDTVLGDNSFAFVPYPHGWEALRDRLFAACRPGARLFLRFFAVPDAYRAPDTATLVRAFLREPALNSTALRAAFMFAQWDPHTCGLDMDAAVARFDAELEAFFPLLDKFGLPADNDLVTLRKYAGTGITLYAPPQRDTVALLGERFRVIATDHGPTPLSAHFPLLVLERPDGP